MSFHEYGIGMIYCKLDIQFRQEFMNIGEIEPKKIMADLLDKIVITEEDIKKVANQSNFYYILTSAKTGENVNDAFLYIAYRFLESAS